MASFLGHSFEIQLSGMGRVKLQGKKGRRQMFGRECDVASGGKDMSGSSVHRASPASYLALSGQCVPVCNGHT